MYNIPHESLLSGIYYTYISQDTDEDE